MRLVAVLVPEARVQAVRVQAVQAVQVRVALVSQSSFTMFCPPPIVE